MRILQVVEATEAGVARHVLDLAEGLLDRGHEVHLAHSPRRADGVFQERVAGLHGLRASTIDLRRGPHPSDIAGILTLRRELRALGPFDVVHGHSSKGGAVARLAALTIGVPAVYTPHAIRTMDPTASSLTRGVVGCAERLLACVDGLVIAVSPMEAEHMARMGMPRRKLRVVPNGIRPAHLPGCQESRHELGLPQDAAVVGFVGRLAAQKAPDVLAMVGDGPLRTPLQGACEVLRLRDRVRWLGRQNGQRAMPAFDIFVLPSRYEGLPIVLLEACLAGLPIIATRAATGGLLVEAGVNGILIPMDEPEALADAVLRLLANPDERAAYGRASLCRAARFGYSRMIDETEQVYREAIAL